MTIRIFSYDGKTVSLTISERLQRISQALLNSGNIITDALYYTTRNHFSTIYPGSKHYSPDKVTKGQSSGNSGEIKIDVPGITRNFRDLDIKPKFRKYLTIPMHRDAYGKKATEFDDLFKVTKKNGKEFLARNTVSGISFMYVLSKGVHQRKDDRLLPDALTYGANLLARISAKLNNL